MKFDHLLLGLLAQQPRSGYDLGRWLATEGQFLRSNADLSQIYRTLSRMTAGGLVEFAVDERAHSPSAKVYSLTAHGVDELFAWLESPYEPRSRFQDADFLARFACGGILRPDTLLPMFDAEIAYREEQTQQYRGRDRSLPDHPGAVEYDRALAQELLDDGHAYGTAASDAWMAWLRTERAKLAERLGHAPAPASTRSSSSRSSREHDGDRIAASSTVRSPAT